MKNTRKKMGEWTKYRLSVGSEPCYTTKRGKLLWIDNAHYDDYSSACNCKILVGADGKFWGYSNDPRINIFEGGK